MGRVMFGPSSVLNVMACTTDHIVHASLGGSHKRDALVHLGSLDDDESFNALVHASRKENFN